MCVVCPNCLETLGACPTGVVVELEMRWPCKWSHGVAFFTLHCGYRTLLVQGIQGSEVSWGYWISLNVHFLLK